VGAALGQGKDTTLQHCGRSSTIAPGQDLEAMQPVRLVVFGL